MKKVVISDRIRFSRKLLPASMIKDRYDFAVYDDPKCEKCDNLENRHNDICDNCPAFMGRYRFFSKSEAKNGVWSVPQGDVIAITKTLSRMHPDIEVVDKRKRIPFDNPIKFTGRLYGKDEADEEGRPRANQKKVLRKWLRYQNGIIRAQPRTGKCLTGGTILNTNEGWLEMRELISREGYHRAKGSVSNHKGTAKISHHYMSSSETIYIETKNGVTVRCTPEHPLMILTSDLRWVWRKADAIQPGDMIVSKTRNHRPIWGIRTDVSVAEAKLMGYMTANGRGNCFSSKDQDVVRDFKRCADLVFSDFPGYHLRKEVQSNKSTPSYFLVGVHDALVERGMFIQGSRNKQIPLLVRQSPREIVQAYLNAYFACDSHNNGRHINLITASAKLSRQLQTILHMGFDVRCWRKALYTYARNSKNPTIRKYYRLQPSTADVEKFLALFPDAKVAKCENLSMGDNHQDNYIRPLPPVRQFLMQTYARLDSGLKQNHSTLYQYRDGSLKTWKFPFGTKRTNLTRAKFNSVDWSNQLQDLKKLDPIAYKSFKKLLRNDPAIEIVCKVKKIERQVPVYDLTVPGSHAFYANGVLSHNTVMATALYCKMGQKTVIIANQKEFLKQFYETATGRKPPTFRGSKKVHDGQDAQRRRAVTNIRQIQEKTGKEVIRFIDKFSQLEKADEYYDIVLMTYQALMRDPERILKWINGRYSFLIVDEGHKGGAHGYMRVLAQLNVAHRLTLTATDKRKDSRDKFSSIIMGPVVASSSTNSLIPHIYFEPTGFTLKPMPKRWPTVYKRACYDLKRNRLIVKKLFQDLRAGHRVILVPVDYIEHINGLVKMINRQAEINVRKRGEDWPIELAKAYHGKTERDEILDWVDSKEWDVPNKKVSSKERGDAPRILVARASMIKEGIDFARPTSIHIVLPMSGNARAGAPAFYQLSNRVCTPILGKRQPIVRIYVDDIGMFQGAISGLLWHELYPNSNLKKKSQVKYYISKQQYVAAKAYTSRKKKLPQNEAKIFSGSWV